MTRWLRGGAARFGATFMLGVACALWLMPLLAGPVVQRLRLDRDEALKRAETAEEQVRKLKEALESRQGSPGVQRVQVQLEGPDHRVVLEAERRVQKQLTSQYAGRPIDDVSPFLVARRLQGTILEIDGVKYQLDIEVLAVGPELAVYGVLKPLKG